MGLPLYISFSRSLLRILGPNYYENPTGLGSETSNSSRNRFLSLVVAYHITIVGKET